MKKKYNLENIWAEDEDLMDESWDIKLDNDALKVEEASFLDGYYET
ncbi:hypothetical protein HYV89_05775 [Candidatus Woesearchaeota archaeon]|nr:hypothetical protein [Candidatus Woesearchaeota archaeon]